MPLNDFMSSDEDDQPTVVPTRGRGSRGTRGQRGAGTTRGTRARKPAKEKANEHYPTIDLS